METTTRRAERLEALTDMYDAQPRTGDDPQPEPARYALIQQYEPDQQYYVSTTDSITAALDSLGDDVLWGWLPAGVIDLDTGESIPVHVANPVVTRSEDPEAALPTPWNPPRAGRAQPAHPSVAVETSNGAPVLVCPYRDCHAPDRIAEEDQARRINRVVIGVMDRSSPKVYATVCLEEPDFRTIRQLCTACHRPVVIPPDVELSWR